MEEPTLGSLDWTCHEAGNLSPRQILRMANEGKFPQPVRVTEGNERQRGRIAFVRSEVRTWVTERIAERDNIRLDRVSGGSLAHNDSTTAKPKISHVPQEVDSKGRKKVDHYRARRGPGPRPAATPDSR
jgi:predicted DNA-binding transcriptional regulator AlpA